MSNSHSKASRKYDKEHTKSKLLKLNKKTDSDILQHLEILDESFNGYIKKLIRKDMGK